MLTIFSVVKKWYYSIQRPITKPLKHAGYRNKFTNGISNT